VFGGDARGPDMARFRDDKLQAAAIAVTPNGIFKRRARQGSNVAQIKKKEIRRAILDAAYKLFSKRGYSDTNIANIARMAGVAPANVYVYFPSKLEILFSIYEPWLTKQFDTLEKSLQRTTDPRQRLRKILSTLWREIPSADNGFANNMMQAISAANGREGYSPSLRLAVEARLARLLEDCLPAADRKNARDIASIMLMAFDGYALNFHLKGGAVCPARQLALFADIMIARPQQRGRLPAAKAAARGRASRAAADGRARVAG
jgi:AcrR family transcriptional regulator